MTFEDSSFLLSPDERARLRPTVNVDALERLLAHVPATDRGLMLLGFYERRTAGELLDALRAAGIDEQELASLRELADHVPVPPHLAHPENDFDPLWVPPVSMVNLSVDPPEDPVMRSLWDAVEQS